MTTVLFIILGLIPAATIRYAIARKQLEMGAAIGVCLAILLSVSIVVTGFVQKQFAKPEPQEVMGPVPILAELVYRMATISLPVTVLSFFILRGRSRD